MSRTLYAMVVFLLVQGSIALADGDIGLENQAPPEKSKVATAVSAETKLNRLEVDQKKSSRIAYEKFAGSVHYDWSSFLLGLEVQNLVRERNDFSTDNEFVHNTQGYTPSLMWRINERFTTLVSHTEYQTESERDSFEDESYDLDARRTSAAVAYQASQQRYQLTYHSELRAEHDYLMGQFPLTDREYIPTQVDLDWSTAWSRKFSSEVGLRYSHYNHDVYKDQYDSDVPKTPTMAQVFDYLLTLRTRLHYQLFTTLGFDLGLERKAALDVNSYTGDEYVLAYTGAAEVLYRPMLNVLLGVGTEYSEGQKTHEVQGQSYDYASKRASYHGSLTVRF